MNTSIAEQTFAWFRGYARMLNSMRAARHHCVVLLFSRKHNTLMDSGATNQLSAFRTGAKKQRGSSSYVCNLS